MLHSVGIPAPERVAKQYPFSLSGGMCQRVMIAIATALQPQVLIADEPTSSLDVTVQALILDDLRRLRDRGTAILLITHDFGVVAQLADEVAVMYGGRVVESGDVVSIFRRPRHPYTWALLSTSPRLDYDRDRLPVIPGSPPGLLDQPDECPFLPRCPKALSQCRLEPFPLMEEVEPGHMVACYNHMLDVA
jgi:oligopeptide/dipeptide ABC transporter ATP-binding protein